MYAAEAIVIIFFAAGIIALFVLIYLSIEASDREAEKKIAAGCKPLVTTYTGSVRYWDCPNK